MSFSTYRSQQRAERSELVATYAKAAFYLAISAAALVYSAGANARNLAFIPNQAGGEIVLTTAETAACPKGSLLAFSRGDNGMVITGCWVPSESYVLIKWIRSGSVKMFDIQDFRLFDEEQRNPVARQEQRMAL